MLFSTLQFLLVKILKSAPSLAGYVAHLGLHLPYIFGYLMGPEGGFNDQTVPILSSSYPLTHIYVHVK